MDGNSLAEHLGLASVAAVIYGALARKTPLPASPDEQAEGLDWTASAIAHVVPVFVADEKGSRRQLTGSQLLGARFRQGARALVTPDGREYSDLSIQRADLPVAYSVLRSLDVIVRRKRRAAPAVQ